MRRNFRRLAVLVLGIGITVAAVVYFLHGMRGQWRAMGQAFAQANYLYLIPAIGFLGLVYYLRILRWKLFLRPIADVSASDVATATLIGFMSTCVLPLRPGEVIRPYVLHRKAGISFGNAAGTAIGLERTFDLMGTLFLLLAAWGFLWAHAGDPAPPVGATGAQLVRSAADQGGLDDGPEQQQGLSDVLELIEGKGLQLMVLMAVGLSGLMVLAFFPSFALGVAGRLLRVLPESWNRPLMGLIESVAEPMMFLRSPARVSMAILLTLAAWASFPLSTYSLMRGFDLQLPFAGVMFVQVVITVAVIAPQAPGFFGVYQSAAATAALLFGVSRGNAGAFANMLWAINVIPITAVGLAVLSGQGLNLRQLASGARQAAEREPEDGGEGA